jgi:pimeloyl-ACP methyl ester carboxylesterase
VFLTTSNPFERFRIGDGPNSYDPDPAKRKLMPGSQFPNEGYENFVKQGVPRWTTNDDATLAAYIAEIDRVCPCVILFHSQAGTFGFKAAQARPDKVKALIAIEPAGVGDPAKADVLKNIPTLFVYGDYIERDSRWPKIRATGVAFADAIRAAGGSAEVVDLPQGRHLRQFAHDDDGQEQSRSGRADPGLAGRQGADQEALSDSATTIHQRKAAQHARNENSRRSRPADDGLQFVPLLRGPVRGISGDGNAPLVFRWRPQLSRQSLP